MADSRKGKRGRFGPSARSGIVAVEVGPDRVKYYIHEALLVEHSEYFQKALNGPWMEAKGKSFDVFVDWLYYGRLPPEYEGWLEEGPGEGVDYAWFVAMEQARIRVCALGDRLLSASFCRAAEHDFIDRLDIAAGSVTPYPQVIIFAFAHLPPTSLILQALIDVYCNNYNENNYDKKNTWDVAELQLQEQLPHSFLVGVMRRYAKVKNGLQEKLRPLLTIAINKVAQQGIVTVKIGSAQTEYFIHKTQLQQYSEHFKKAFNGSWKESEEGTIYPEGFEYYTFNVFVDWLYTQKLPETLLGWLSEAEEKIDFDKRYAHQVALLRACAFGDRFLAPAFSRACQDHVVKWFTKAAHAPLYEAVIYAFENLPSDSIVLQLLIDAHCRYFYQNADTEENGELERRQQLPKAF
ncbi:hypothetical protein SLS59_007426 [Nothophoma quercina]|uniref:BTB domain-containing protein n=1 Tax=Nothophoma quercina TaxID=749835 RepID=A0ABR3QZ13_9PLEO